MKINNSKIVNIKDFGAVADPKNFLIEISGGANECSITPICGRGYSGRSGSESYVDMSLITKAGLLGFLSINACEWQTKWTIGFGMETCVQVETPYPWTKHSLICNVPIETYCMNGWVESALHALKIKIKGLIK